MCVISDWPFPRPKKTCTNWRFETLYISISVSSILDGYRWIVASNLDRT
jgi:hypothetical protein